MECYEAQRQIAIASTETLNWIIEGRSSERRDGDLRKHLSSCPSCTELVESERRFRTTIQQSAPKVEAPSRILERVLDQIAVEGLDGGDSRLSPLNFFRRGFIVPLVAACLIAGIALCLLMFWNRDGHSALADLVEDHLRYLPSETQTRVPLLSPERVEVWFQEAPDLATTVLECADLQLLGGISSYLFGQRVVHLIYEHEDARLSLFIFRDQPVPLDRTSWKKHANERIGLGWHAGYNIGFWRENRLTYAVVVDNPQTDLVRLASHHITPGVESSSTDGDASVPGVNLAALTADQRTHALQLLNTEKCTCACDHPVASCRHLDAHCETSLKLAEAIVHR